MPLHRVPKFDDADWLPAPLAVVAHVAGVAVLAWGAYAFAKTAPAPGLAGAAA